MWQQPTYEMSNGMVLAWDNMSSGTVVFGDEVRADATEAYENSEGVECQCGFRGFTSNMDKVDKQMDGCQGVQGPQCCSGVRGSYSCSAYAAGLAEKQNVQVPLDEMQKVQVLLACENGIGIGAQVQVHGSVSDNPWQCDTSFHAGVMDVNVMGNFAADLFQNRSSELATQNK